MMLTLIAFVAVLSILVFVHEFGHFWTAKKLGLIPEEFGFGFPPRAVGIYRDKDGRWRYVFGKKKINDAADTIYSLNWIPIGGFVKLGEDDDPGDDPNHFNNRPIWQRTIILLAGVTMNIVLAAALFAFGFTIGLPQALDNLAPGAKVSDQHIQIVEVLPGTPAEEAGIKVSDIIVSVDGNQFKKSDELIKYVDEHQGEEVVYVIKRGGEEIKKTVTPKVMAETGRGGIGIGIMEVGLVRYPVWRAVWEGLKTTAYLIGAIIIAFYKLIKSLLLGAGLTSSVSGPVGIAAMTGQMARMGLAYLIQFAALLSINLAIINALPFPALDGGRVLFLIIEKIKGRPVKKEVESTIHYIGFALLMLLVLVVTFKDIGRYSQTWQALWEKIKR